MHKLPLKLEKSPVAETTLEIRFMSSYPDDAVFGIIFQALQEKFSSFKLRQLIQIPPGIKVSDPHIKYQPTHSLTKDNLLIGIGCNVLIFSNRANYLGWEEFKNFADSAIQLIENSKAVKNIEGISLQYINLINTPLAESTNLTLSLCNQPKKEDDIFALQLQREIGDGFTVAFQLNDNVLVRINNGELNRASIINIQTVKKYNTDFAFNRANIADVLDKLHSTEKQYFFELLKEEYVETLKPIYN